MQVGEETDVEVNYPVDFPNEELRGSIRTLRIKVKEIRRKDTPEIDDDFAREHSDKETLAELREDVRERMQTGVQRESERQVRESIVDRLLAINSLPVPPSLEKRYLDAMLHDAVHRQQGGDPNDHDHEITDEMREKFAEAYRPVAQRAMRKMILVDNLRRQNDVKATDEELDARLAELAEEQGTSPEQMRSLIERAGNLDRLRGDLEEDKVFDLLEEKATITVKEELPPAPESVPTQQQDEVNVKE
jgi:trigger factor